MFRRCARRAVHGLIISPQNFLAVMVLAILRWDLAPCTGSKVL